MIRCIVPDCTVDAEANITNDVEREKRMVIDHINHDHPGYNIEIPCSHDWKLEDTVEQSVVLTSNNDFGRKGEKVTFPIEVSTCRRCLQTLNRSVEPKTETADAPPKGEEGADGEAD